MCVCVEGSGFTAINRDIKSAHVGKNIEFSEILQSPQSYLNRKMLAAVVYLLIE